MNGINRTINVLIILSCIPGSLLGDSDDQSLDHDQVDYSKEMTRNYVPAKVINFDNPAVPRNKITDSFYFGLKFEGKYSHEDNFDLEFSRPDDLGVIKPKSQLAFLYKPSEKYFVFMNSSLGYSAAVQDKAGNNDSSLKLQVKQLYVSFSEVIGEGSAARIGRQRVRDYREWYYDEELDGLRLFYNKLDFTATASVTRKRLIDKDLLNAEENKKINYYFLSLGYKPSKKMSLEGYALYLDDRTDEEGQPIFLGVRAYGTVFKRLKYWADFAHVFGKGELVKKRVEGNRVETNDDLDGFGLDVGFSYAFKAPLNPYVTLGYAYGTGDNDDNDKTSNSFQQTGLQDNTGRFHGVTSLKYYGELFDPELSNMSIFTVGFGIKLNRKNSVDLIYHHYRQDKAYDAIRDANIEASPNGIGRDLGHEIDLVIGSREFNNINMELNIGYFWPGDAFSETQNNAFLAEIKFSYKF